MDDNTGNTTNTATRTVYWTAGIVFVHALAFFGLLLTLVMAVPAFMAVFTDFDVELPAMTLWTISISHLVVSYWYLLACLFFSVDIGVLVGLGRMRAGRKTATIAWFVAVLIAIAFFEIFTAVSLYLPMERTIETLH